MSADVNAAKVVPILFMPKSLYPWPSSEVSGNSMEIDSSTFNNTLA